MARLVHQDIEQLRVMAILFRIFVPVWPVFQNNDHVLDRKNII